MHSRKFLPIEAPLEERIAALQAKVLVGQEVHWGNITTSTVHVNTYWSWAVALDRASDDQLEVVDTIFLISEIVSKVVGDPLLQLKYEYTSDPTKIQEFINKFIQDVVIWPVKKNYSPSYP